MKLNIALPATALLFATPCFSDDCNISVGGSPVMLASHRSVSMASELVLIDVLPEQVRVDCLFRFINQGPECTVRMGFPDGGEGGADKYQDSPDDKRLLTTFTSFRSWVNGRQVATTALRAGEVGILHVKDVRIPANGRVLVRDLYTQPRGAGQATIGGKDAGYASIVNYTLHTGSSWRGAIGKAEIVVRLHSRDISVPVHLLAVTKVALRDIGRPEGRRLKEVRLPNNAVVWKGPSAPSVSGRTLRFARTNFKPTLADDIELTFGYQQPARAK